MMFEEKIFGERINKIRKQNGVKQKTLAELLGVTRTQISDMENGKTGTSLTRLVALAEFFHVSTDYLLGLTDDPAWLGE